MSTGSHILAGLIRNSYGQFLASQYNYVVNKSNEIYQPYKSKWQFEINFNMHQKASLTDTFTTGLGQMFFLFLQGSVGL